ncbi:MAG: hypothetical protein FJ270_06185 [Planctomycetes bacterium]|nr:hypothetical protein [Planctomycetota bacterium]
MKPIARLVLVAATLMACDSDPDSVNRVFGTEDERAREQEQLNAISEQDDANNADAGITNDAEMQPLNP